MQPPPLNNTDRFTPLSQLLLFSAAILGSLVMFTVFAAIPAFTRMFMDFGSELPLVTRIVLQIRHLFLFAGIATGVFAYLTLYKNKGGSSGSVWIFAVLGFEFVLFVMAVSALFMPILQLAATSPTK